MDVDSSVIDQLRYEKLRLDVVFKDGRVYRYFEVPETVFEALIGAESIGKFYNRGVKPAYEYMRIK